MITALTITSNVIHSQVQLKAAWFKLEVKSRKNEKVSSKPPPSPQTSFDHDAIILDNTPPPSPEVTMSSANESKIIKAIETLTYVQTNGYVQPRKHVMGYQVSA